MKIIKRSIFITMVSLLISVASIPLLHSQASVIDAIVYFSEDGNIILSFSDAGQAAFVSIKNGKLLIGTYAIDENHTHILFLAQSNEGEIYAENKFEILSEGVIQDVVSGQLFYRNS